MKQMIGISVGSQNTVVGVLKGGVVDIILSETSSRCVPTLSAFSERERTFGDQALSTIKSNFNRTIIYPNRWLGMQPDWPFFAEEMKYATCQPQIDKHNRIGFEINYKNELQIYYPENIMGLFFNKLKQNWRKAGYDTKEVVVSVPDYFNAYERKALIDALSIADLQCTSLLNESSAVAIEYGIKRRLQFDDKVPKIVAFVDMGQSKTTISFSSFTKNNQKVFSVTSDRFCGARDFDFLLMEHFSNIFKKKYGSNPMNSQKCRLRMMDAIAKTRKILTANREAALNVESLIDDEDMIHNLTRDEFERIIEPVLEKYRTLLKNALENAMSEGKFELSQLSSVEMVGDAVRTPILQQIVTDVFGMELSKTLLPDECIARGCTFFAAMNSPFFTLKDFTFEHYNPYTIVLEYPFLKDGQVQLRTHSIIKKGENLPNRKSIKFSEKQTPHQEVIQLRYFYNNEEISFLNNPMLKTYMVSIPHVKEEQWILALQFYMDQNGIPHLDKATINEVYYEEHPVKAQPNNTTNATSNAPKEGENKQEKDNQELSDATTEEKKTDKIKKERSTVCIIKMVECLFGLPQSLVDSITQREANQENDDRLLVMAINKRNEIENFIYSTRSKLESELEPFLTSEEKEHLFRLMQEMEDWLYSGDEQVYIKSVLENKGKNLNDLGTKIYKRYHDWGKLSESLEKLEKGVNQNIQKLNESNINAPYLRDTDKSDLEKVLSQYNNILNEGRVQFTNFPKFAEPPSRYEDVDKTTKELLEKCANIYKEADKRFKNEQKKLEEEMKKASQNTNADINMNTGAPSENPSDGSTQEMKSPDSKMNLD